MSLPETHSEADAAAALGKSKFWLATEARAGRVPFIRVGRTRRYTADHVAQILAAHEQRPVSLESVRGLTPRSAARRRRAS